MQVYVAGVFPDLLWLNVTDLLSGVRNPKPPRPAVDRLNPLPAPERLHGSRVDVVEVVVRSIGQEVQDRALRDGGGRHGAAAAAVV
jgi:hypothetical protein